MTLLKHSKVFRRSVASPTTTNTPTTTDISNNTRRTNNNNNDTPTPTTTPEEEDKDMHISNTAEEQLIEVRSPSSNNSRKRKSNDMLEPGVSDISTKLLKQSQEDEQSVLPLPDVHNDSPTPVGSSPPPKTSDNLPSHLTKLPQYNFTRYCYRHNPEYHNYQQNLLKKESSSIEGDKDSIRNWIRDDPLFKKFENEITSTTEHDEIKSFLSIFSGSAPQKRELLLKMILNLCCSPQLSFISSEVNSLIKLDFISTLPLEISMKILSYLDCSSLCSASKVSKSWKSMADDDRVWYHLCEQHIDKKCPQCGWGLPLLQMKRRRVIETCTDALNQNACIKTSRENAASQTTNTYEHNNNKNKNSGNNTNVDTVVSPCKPGRTKTRPWKVVYKERFNVENNWRKGIYTEQLFVGHMDGVLDCKIGGNLLFTGSYDCTVGIWDINTGNLLRRLSGHSQGVKTLHFDDSKLITGSLDKTIRVWNYQTGQCVSTYRGHTDAVLSIDAFQKIIVSSSADCTVKVWHVESRTCFTLRGHTEWVSCVKLHPTSFTCYSSSDDTTIKMWDIRENKLLKTFNGHVAQVQKVIPLTIIDEENLITDIDYDRSYKDPELNADLKYPTHLLSCSLDNTIKLWHVQSGTCVRTHFGHVEGVWDIAADNFRIISGSHDKTVKVWDLQSGKLVHSFNKQHTAPVTCVDIGDSQFVSGDETGKVSMFHFDC